MFTFPVAHFGGELSYEIDQSIRFNDDDSAYLSRTPGSAGDKRTWTFSVWTKRGNLGADRRIFTAANNGTEFFFDANDKLNFYHYSGGFVWRYISTAVFRDPSAWYHFLLRVDTTDATAGNRIRVYVNGQQINDWDTSTAPSLNAEGFVNGTSAHYIGRYSGSDNNHWDGYLAEINHVDGSSLAPTSFGETNDDGVWIPIKASPTYGTNGFYITGATASDLGEDFSGNNNDYTSSGLTTADQMVDTPTTVYPTINRTFDYYTSGNTSYYRPNYAVSIVSDGDLKIVYASPNTPINYCTMSFGSSGKFYFEVTAAVASALVIGIGGSKNIELGIGSSSSTAMANVIGYYANGTLFDQNATAATYGNASSIANGEFVGVAYSVDDDAIWFCDNGTWVDGNGTESSATVLAQIEAGDTTSAASTGFTDDQNAWFPFVAAVGDYPTAVFNFGQSSFTGAAPSGFTHLNTANLATPSIKDGSAYFQTTLYEGNGSTQSIDQDGNSTFKPDWVWIKNRDAADQHALFDVVRGATELMGTNVVTAEATNDDTLTAFESDGFAVGDDVIVNTNNESYVAWQWLAGNNSTGSNTDGSINTTATTVNTTAGFSISTYTGNATVGATVGHGLGIAPKVVIVKSRSNTENWIFGHDSVGWNKAMYMSSTGAPFTLDIYWNNTAPTSSVVELHDHSVTNGSGYTYVMYSFAEIPGYSSIGSYTGNGSTDGPFISTNGMAPKWVMIKRTNSTGFWDILDTTREPFNSVGNQLFADRSDAEASNDHEMDFLSNGIKIRDTSTSVNASGSTYIYMAFAENPFGGDGVAPATAR